MGGMVEIRDRVTWLPSGGVYDGVLERLATQLDAADPDLATTLRHSLRFTGAGNCNLPELTPRRFQSLLEATGRAFNQAWRGEPASDGRLDQYPSIIDGLSMLKALLYTDPRVVRPLSTFGSLLIRDGSIWHAPAWIYNLVLEYLANSLETEDSALAETLIAVRTTDEDAECDLRSWEPLSFHKLLSRTEWLVTRCGESRIYDVDARELLAELAPRLRELKHLLDTDLRVTVRD